MTGCGIAANGVNAVPSNETTMSTTVPVTYEVGDIVVITYCKPHFIWVGIECRLIEMHTGATQFHTPNWRCETIHGRPITIYLYEEQFKHRGDEESYHHR